MAKREPEHAGRSERAGRTLHQSKAALRSVPSYANASLAYAVAFTSYGDAAQAEHHLRKAIELAPNSFEAHLKLGQMLYDRCDAAQAAPRLRKARESLNPRIRDAANQLLTEK